MARWTDKDRIYIEETMEEFWAGMTKIAKDLGETIAASLAAKNQLADLTDAQAEIERVRQMTNRKR